MPQPPGGNRPRRLGLTVVELTVVVAILGLVLALSLSVYQHAIRLGRQTACLSNLRQLAFALNSYFTQYKELPPDDSPARFDVALLPFVKDRAVFHCPVDAEPGASSYAPFYVHRREMDPQDFMLGCPRHAHGRVATVLYGSAGAEGSRLGPVTHNGGAVAVGDRVTGGILRFADGSVASMTEGLSVDVVTSFQRGDGTYYTVLRVPVGEMGTVGVQVNPRSRLEVITPAAIAGSEGTRYYVQVLRENGVHAAVVYVQHGRVRMTSRGNRPTSREVQKGEAYRGERPSGKIEPCAIMDTYQLPWLPYPDPNDRVYDPASGQ